MRAAHRVREVSVEVNPVRERAVFSQAVRGLCVAQVRFVEAGHVCSLVVT